MPAETIPPNPEVPVARERGRKHREKRRAIVPPRQVLDGYDPYVEQRQARAFDLSVTGISNNQIAGLLGISRQLVAKDIATEGLRRAQEREADRAAIIEHGVSRYEKVIGDISLRVNALLGAANASAAAVDSAGKPVARNWKAETAYRTIIPKEIALLLKAQRQSEELRGLLDTVTINNNVLSVNMPRAGESAMDLFNELPGDVRAAVRKRARELRLAGASPAAAQPETIEA